ncbi:putative tail component [Escherichia coli 6-175-07_S3_C3]|nr:putative tail component [Escherichia coli DEC6D]KEJ49023.1 putative tail component [Escherichia coli 2-427-07_S4_C3]KEJ63490.1 putative tail component [Escherichia coli 3-267-03_S4_C1]KEJ78981.1 putative tail component [Escherichia coli 6-175-07_S3_C2]KEM04123.1 putative tail component [Escherichia coli 6-175-07_S3_C3]KEM22386.1 putative tail component [Escherichia coli 6-319-05_S3_C1]KEM31688.1 putative tail component [Escherichia coli 6-319-05_S3_C2]KEM84417.1 putative tail component [E
MVVIFALICSGGHGSMVRLPPVVMSAKSATARTTIAREDAEDHQVKLSA